MAILWKRIQLLDRYKLSLWLLPFLFSFIFIRIYNSWDVFLLPHEGDDGGYFAYSTALLQTHHLNWCAPEFADNPGFASTCQQQGKPYNNYSPGPAITLLPFQIFGVLLSKFGIFTPTQTSPLMFWWIIGSFFLLFFSVLLLFEIANLLVKNRSYAFWTTVFFSTGNIVLYYVYRRPLMAHCSEFFLFFLSVYLLLKNRMFVLGLSIGLLIITRYNNAYLGLMAAALVFFAQTSPQKKIQNLTFLALGVLPAIFVFFLNQYLQTGSLIYKTTQYGPEFSLLGMLALRASNIRRIFDFFMGPHWGVFWLMPFFFIEVWILARIAKKSSSRIWKNKTTLISLILINFFYLNMIANLPNHMSYGFRILIPTYCTLHLAFLWVLSFQSPQEAFPKKYIFAGCVTAVLAIFNLNNFESNSDTLTLTPHPSIEAGVYRQEFRDRVVIDAPNYAFHSLKHTITGKALTSLAVTPLAAYPLMAVAENPRIQGNALASKTLAYYQSPKRKIEDLKDLTLLFQYQIVFLVFLILGGLFLILSKIIIRK